MDDSQSDRMMRLLAEVHCESDRAAAILAAAGIDSRLTQLLRKVFGPETSQSTSLFRPDDPLGSMAAKIEVAFRTGVIGSDLHREFHLIRKIRNRFAHSADSLSFEESPIRDLAEELTILRTIRTHPGLNLSEEKNTPRERFLFSVVKLMVYLEFLIDTREPFPHRGDELLRDLIQVMKEG